MSDRKQLPPPADHPDSLALVPRNFYRSAAPAPPGYYASYQDEFDFEDPPRPLSHYLWVIRKNLWRILAFLILASATTFVISSRLRPVYEATVVIDIDRQAPSGILGRESERASSPSDADQFLATQLRIFQSDAVIRPVAQKYNLLEAEGQLKGLSEPRKTEVLNAPLVLKNLRVTKPANTFLLLASYRSHDPNLAASVANEIAKSYVEHTYRIRITSSATLSSFMSKQLDDLRAQMERSSEKLAQFDREMNVINPEEKTTILSTRLVQLNTERTNAEADRMKKEAAFNQVSFGSLEAVQISGQGEALQKLAERLNEALQKFAVVKSTFGPNFPEYRKASSDVAELRLQFEDARRNAARRIEAEFRQALNREQMLSKAVNEAKAEFDKLNVRSFEYQQLKRGAENDRKLYDELVRRIREAEINSGIQNNNIRIADQARVPAKPVLPNMWINMTVAVVLSLLAAIVAAILADLLNNTIRDPEQTSRALNTQVIGTLPAVKGALAKANGLLAPSVADIQETALAKRENGYRYSSISGYEESIRTLRNTILLGDFDRHIRSLLVTSASPGEGKSTTAVNLAVAHANQNKKTLLIDADLRRPSIHKKLDIEGNPGLSNYLVEDTPWKATVVQHPLHRMLSVIPAGPPSRRASDLIGQRIIDLIDEAGKEYDFIIVDSPPLLGFAEPLQMAIGVDGVLIVTQAGQTNLKSVRAVIATLNRLRANVLGVVLNQVTKNMSDGYRHYAHYRQYYADAQKAGQ